MSKMELFYFIAASCLLGLAVSQIGADGFENNPCIRLLDFSIDGDWWATTADEIDWSSVLEGTRDSNSNSEWLSTQNQCTKNPSIRWGYYYLAGIFCDTFDNDEQSHFQTKGTPAGLESTPLSWVPLISTSMQNKGDLTNVYYVGSALDLIICAAFERIDVNGAGYMDLEFNKIQVEDPTLDTSSDREFCHDAYVDYDGTTYSANTNWKCRYVDRVDTDIQIAFKIANAITNSVIIISSWDDANQEYVAIRTELLKDGVGSDTYGYESSDGVFRAHVNDGPILASSFGYICDDKNPNLTMSGGCPYIPNQGAFFEACIDFKKMGFYSLDFTSVIVKARASSNGAYKDTSGPITHIIKGPENYWSNWTDPDTGEVVSIYKDHVWNSDARLDSECNLTLTPFPTFNPTTPTDNPTTYAPTGYTTDPTTGAPTQPTLTPTIPTVEPTVVTPSPTPQPTDTSSAPSGDTQPPTHWTQPPTDASSAPTINTPGPTPLPTVTEGNPSRAPTDSPTPAPTALPTVTEGNPSRAPTPSPSKPPSKFPSIPPTLNPTVTRACSDDQNPQREDCPDTRPYGCSMLVTMQVEVCLFSKKFDRDDVYDIFIESYIGVMESSPNWIDLCPANQAAMEEYDITYADAAAETAAETVDCSDTCEESTDGTIVYPYTFDLMIGLFCSDCVEMRNALEDYAENKAGFDSSVQSAQLSLSKTKDTTCGTGFGAVNIVCIESVARGTDYSPIGDVVECDASAGTGDDDGNDGDDFAITHKPFVYVMLCFVPFVLLYPFV